MLVTIIKITNAKAGWKCNCKKCPTRNIQKVKEKILNVRHLLSAGPTTGLGFGRFLMSIGPRQQERTKLDAREPRETCF